VKWELTTDNYGQCQVSKISHVMCVWKQVSQKTTLYMPQKNTKNKDTTKDFSSRTRTRIRVSRTRTRSRTWAPRTRTKTRTL